MCYAYAQALPAEPPGAACYVALLILLPGGKILEVLCVPLDTTSSATSGMSTFD